MHLVDLLSILLRDLIKFLLLHNYSVFVFFELVDLNSQFYQAIMPVGSG